jgi:tRNA nucleotidyltransferase (CCA-adding enzyme)
MFGASLSDLRNFYWYVYLILAGTGFENKEYPQIDYLKALYQAALAVDVQQVIADGFEKQGIRDELTRRRIAAVKAEKTRLNA